MPLSQVWGRFVAERGTRLKPLTLKKYEAKLAVIIHTVGDVTLAQVNGAFVRDLVAKRRQVTSDIQVREELTTLSSLMTFAIARGLDGAPDINPCSVVPRKMLAGCVPRPRGLTVEQVQKLLAAADGPVWPILLPLMLQTGLRPTEARELLWEEIDFHEGVINLKWQREKTSRGRVIPIPDTVLRTLATVQRVPGSPYVFTNPETGTAYRSLWKGWLTIRARAGVPTARIHDLRHTFATHARRRGMSKEDRMAIMGHSTQDTQALYAVADLGTLRESLKNTGLHTVFTQERGFHSDKNSDMGEAR